jgi:hypothetical protein
VVPYLSPELIQTIVSRNEPPSKPPQQRSGPPRGSPGPNRPEAAGLCRGISQQRFASIAVELLKRWFACMFPSSSGR